MPSVKRLRGLLAALSLTVAASTCGGPYDSFPQFCDAFAAQLCAQLQACPNVQQPAMGDCQQSISGEICYCGMNAIANGTEKYHSEKAQACVDAVKRLSCATVNENANPPECSLVYGLASGATPECPVVIGPLPDGGATD